jgi:nucleotide-binding universal stress UspA family protein
VFEARVELLRAVDDTSPVPLGEVGGVSGVSVVRPLGGAGEQAAALAQVRRDAEVFCQQVRDRGLPVHLTVERGAPDEVVRAVAARIDADLVVAATHRAGRLSEGLLDSVSRRIVRVAHRPTLVVPVLRPSDAAGYGRLVLPHEPPGAFASPR